MFKIEIHYKTGSSFETHDATQILEMTWGNINIVKENIDRIREYMKYYNKLEDYRRYKENKPKPPTFVIHNKHFEETPLLLIKLDNGNEVQMWPFWCGYFETFYEAKIKVEY